LNGCSVRVLIPGPLRSYTGEAAVVAGNGGTLHELLADLDRRYPGLRFRVIDEQGEIRRHIKFFVNGDSAANLEPALRDADEVMIVCALSGG
jgi:molybdopterin synthase sulfur carrier subunit